MSVADIDAMKAKRAAVELCYAKAKEHGTANGDGCFAAPGYGLCVDCVYRGWDMVLPKNTTARDTDLSHYIVRRFNGFRGKTIIEDILRDCSVRRGGYIYSLFHRPKGGYIVSRKPAAHEQDFSWEDVAELRQRTICP